MTRDAPRTDPPPPADGGGAPSALAGAVCVGFGTSVVMWCVGFLTHLPGLRAAPVVVGVALLAAQAAGGFVAGRLAPPGRAARLGGGAGLVSGLVNLLVLGAVLTERNEGVGAPGTAVVVLGYLAFSAGVGALAAWSGGRTRGAGRAPADARAWLARFGAVTALAVTPVLLTGGLVTSKEAGLAVPDWPNSFAANMFLFPLSKMTGGIYYEHTHRLFGSLAGLTTLTLAVFAWRVEARRWVRWAAVGALGLVVFQGVLGGVGVAIADDTSGWREVAPNPEAVPDEVPTNYALTTDNAASLHMRMTHGVLGQLTFGWICVVAAFMSTRWRAAPARGDRPADGLLRAASIALVAALALQLVLGAGTRHLQSFPLMLVHMMFAAIVFVLACVAALRAAGLHAERPPLRALGSSIAAIVCLQFVLGFVAMWAVLPYDRVGPEPTHAVLIATAHQATGAALLGASCLLAAWSRRLTRPATAPAPVAPAPA